ncbi:MAG: threonine synthase [Clostridiales bacterium]
MFYESTRGGNKGITSAEVIRMGIAQDGGLFVPSSRKRFTLKEINNLINLNYLERVYEILKYFLNDFTKDELIDSIYKAYSNEKFSNSKIAPIKKLNENVSMLELWHGPTCAFKDMALQILPHLLVKAGEKINDDSEIVLLVATSGDTGKAALEGFKNVKGTRVIVFYPEDGVSEIQKYQMITQEGDNVFTVAVRGNFDDAQNGVKSLFANSDLKNVMKKNNMKFSSANSINWGRLVPQIIYYFSSYVDLVKDGNLELGEDLNFVIPTGNFGNILAAFYAREMGLPINKLICASNENNVLTDFINTGVYNKNREFKRTYSPSMDILISSNLERLLYELNGHNHKEIKGYMELLNETGTYSINDELKEKMQSIFWADFSDDSETVKTIDCINNEYNYVVDTHTAVAIDVYDKYVISTGDITKTIIVSTANPFKFSKVVFNSIFKDELRDENEFDILNKLSDKLGTEIPKGLKDLNNKEILHKDILDKTEMKEYVKKIINI